MRATATGSLPGHDMIEAAKLVFGLFGDDIAFVPELPDRGVTAAMIGRTVGLVPLPIDLQPAGWRVAGGAGADQRRAASLRSADLDLLEEHTQEWSGTLKQQVVGPLTLAATIERQRGDKLLADHGARRELAEALAEGLGDHIADLRRRFNAELIIQIDEPGAPAVLAGQVPTASGFGKHRTVAPPEADQLWRLVTETIAEAGATPVLHSCAADVPVGLAAGAGFAAVAIDLAVTTPTDAWAEAFEGGLDIWAGSTDARALERFWNHLGFDLDEVADRTVVTTPCGLAGRTPHEARRVLDQVVATRHSLTT